MKNTSILILLTTLFSILVSCKIKQTEQREEIIVPKAAVKITSPFEGSIENQLVLNGKTVFLKKNQVVAQISGYITAIHVNFGDKVQEGSSIFEMQPAKTKRFNWQGKVIPILAKFQFRQQLQER